jgi:hypothetical protein
MELFLTFKANFVQVFTNIKRKEQSKNLIYFREEYEKYINQLNRLK